MIQFDLIFQQFIRHFFNSFWLILVVNYLLMMFMYLEKLNYFLKMIKSLKLSQIVFYFLVLFLWFHQLDCHFLKTNYPIKFHYFLQFYQGRFPDRLY